MTGPLDTVPRPTEDRTRDDPEWDRAKAAFRAYASMPGSPAEGGNWYGLTMGARLAWRNVERMLDHAAGPWSQTDVDAEVAGELRAVAGDHAEQASIYRRRRQMALADYFGESAARLTSLAEKLAPADGKEPR